MESGLFPKQLENCDHVNNIVAEMNTINALIGISVTSPLFLLMSGYSR